MAGKFLFKGGEFGIAHLLAEFDHRAVADADIVCQLGNRQKGDLIRILHHIGGHQLLGRGELAVAAADAVQQLL